MSGISDDTAAALATALTRAFPGFVNRRIDELGVDRQLVASAVHEGGDWLESSLVDLLQRPFEEQWRSPLEVFQEAMRYPTDALAEAGVPPIRRDPVEEAALPGDRYGLAPASSQDLGEEVWHAHLAWGTAKAVALTRPVAGLLSADLMDRSRVGSAVSAAGYRLAAWPDLAAVGERGPKPVVAFVDVTHRDADHAVRSLARDGIRVIVYGPHVDDFALTRARSLGARDAMARSRFFRAIGELLPPVV